LLQGNAQNKAIAKIEAQASVECDASLRDAPGLVFRCLSRRFLISVLPGLSFSNCYLSFPFLELFWGGTFTKMESAKMKVVGEKGF
jgi:hypothetical protein